MALASDLLRGKIARGIDGISGMRRGASSWSKSPAYFPPQLVGHILSICKSACPFFWLMPAILAGRGLSPDDWHTDPREAAFRLHPGGQRRTMMRARSPIMSQ